MRTHVVPDFVFFGEVLLHSTDSQERTSFDALGSFLKEWRWEFHWECTKGLAVPSTSLHAPTPSLSLSLSLSLSGSSPLASAVLLYLRHSGIKLRDSRVFPGLTSEKEKWLPFFPKPKRVGPLTCHISH